MRKIAIHIVRLVLLVWVHQSCTKEISDPSDNPFAGNPSDTTTTDTLPATSIEGLHKNIFALKCANPTCHDGSFEPDFRTVQSTYQTLVYQEVIKNDTLGSFTYRVVPGNADMSWLVERVTTDDPFLGRMPLYAVPLSNEEIQNIRDWINNGAPNIDGQPAQYPNSSPEVLYYAVFDLTGDRIDTIRQNGWASPMLFQDNMNIQFLIKVVDDSTQSQNLLVNTFEYSTDPNDFTNAPQITATYFTNDHWTVNFNTGIVNKNQQYYFRYLVRDPDHTNPVGYPSADHPYYYKENASFIVQ